MNSRTIMQSIIDNPNVIEEKEENEYKETEVRPTIGNASQPLYAAYSHVQFENKEEKYLSSSIQSHADEEKIIPPLSNRRPNSLLRYYFLNQSVTFEEADDEKKLDSGYRN